MATPLTHVEESLKLTADALVDVFELHIKNSETVIMFTNHPDITWRGNDYDQVGCSLSGSSRSSDAEESRPTLTIQDLGGVFTPFIKAKTLDYATLVRKRVLRKHLEANLAISQTRMWLISRPKEWVPGEAISFELRNMTEGANFMIPVRQYYPPEFPFVRI
jgi:lambda family phage minor tail protein L